MARITLKTIAKEAGVSIATVSMALRGQGKLAPDNVARIRQIAEDLGYRPDPMLASLASRRFRSGEQAEGLPLALLEFPPFESERNSTTQYREHLIDHATALGYAPQVYSVQEMGRYHDFTRVLYHRGTVGAIITGQPEADLFANRVRWKNFTLVQCGRYRSTLPLHTVRPDIFQAIKLSFESAYARGYRRIGFAIGRHPEVLEDDLARLGAANAHIQIQLDQKDQIPPYFESLREIEPMLKWVDKHQPDVIISFSVALWHFLKDRGAKNSKDIGFACLHLNDESEEPVAFSGLNQSRREIARQSILLTDQMVRHNERGVPETARHILIASTWVEGATLGVKAGED